MKSFQTYGRTGDQKRSENELKTIKKKIKRHIIYIKYLCSNSNFFFFQSAFPYDLTWLFIKIGVAKFQNIEISNVFVITNYIQAYL